MHPFIGWWVERGESTADLVMRAHQQKLFHFYALRHFCAAQNLGLCGGERISQAEKATLPLQHPPA